VERKKLHTFQGRKTLKGIVHLRLAAGDGKIAAHHSSRADESLVGDGKAGSKQRKSHGLL